MCAFAAAANAQDSLKRTPKGAAYIIYTHKTGDKIKLNDVITLEVIQKTDKDSVFFSTYTAGRPVKLQVQPSLTAADMMEIFPLLTAGDSASVKIPSDSIFKGMEDKRPPFLPKGSNLNFLIKIDKVQSLSDAIAERNADMAKLKAQENIDADKYIADKKMVLKTTPSGLKYSITRIGLKPKPLAGDTVYVNYTGKLLNGKVFDTSIEAVAKQSGLNQPGRPYQPINFVVGQSQVIKGWDEGLLLLNEGSKAVFIVPSNLAYAETGTPDGTIPGFSTLQFDVELVKVKRIKHAASPAAKPAVKKHYPLKKKS